MKRVILTIVLAFTMLNLAHAEECELNLITANDGKFKFKINFETTKELIEKINTFTGFHGKEYCSLTYIHYIAKTNNMGEEILVVDIECKKK